MNKMCGKSNFGNRKYKEILNISWSYKNTNFSTLYVKELQAVCLWEENKELSINIITHANIIY